MTIMYHLENLQVFLNDSLILWATPLLYYYALD